MKKHLVGTLTLGLALIPAWLFGCSGAPTTADESTDIVSQAVSTNLIFGQVKNPANAPISGVTITLGGAQKGSLVTDAFGTYAFSVPAGTYTVTASKTGATITQASVNVTVTSADQAENFACDTACGSGSLPAISPFKELVIVDPTVIADPARTSNATCGVWSFCGLMKQLTPAGETEAQFVTDWANSFKNITSLNTLPVEARDIGNFNWPQVNGLFDPTQAPFQLIAITNRADLHAQGNGEGRFVFGGFTGGSFLRMTAIFEYHLPTTTRQPTRQSWVSAFHALGSMDFGSAYNTQLEQITDQFTNADAVPVTNGNPTGSALAQLRTNEVQLSSGSTEPWSMREFHLYALSQTHVILNLSPPSQSPDLSLNGNTQLAQFLETNRSNVVIARETIPATLNTLPLIGGESLEAADPSSPPINWQFTGMDETLRHAFAGQTCDGCHNGETTNIDGFYLISPNPPIVQGTDGTARLGGFVTTIEIPRRASFAQNRLTCMGACAAGAEVATP